jgi:hypothetical protein
MTALTNYASTFTKGGTSMGKCIVIDFPELSTDKIQTTNHASGGRREYIPSKLIDASDITLSLLVDTGTELVNINNELVAGTISQCVVSNPQDTMTFSGWIQSAKEESADAQNPDAVKLTAVIVVTGGVLIS